MNSTFRPVSALIIAGCAMEACAPENPNTVVSAIRSGPFLGETPPGHKATLFAPGFISSGLHD